MVSPEAELLLCCARKALTPAVETRIEELLAADLDWKFLLERSRNDGMTALLHQHLSGRKIPEGALESLREETRDVVRWNLFLIAELRRLLDAFEARRIDAVPFKGIPLAAGIYGDVTLREVVDLDFLLSREQAPVARDLLIEFGYRPEFSFTRRQGDAYLRYHYVYVMTHAQHGAVVELHWSLTARFFCFDFDSASVSRPLDMVRVENQTVPSMQIEDLLLVLCVHGAKHCWDRLIWLCDLAELLSARPAIDWPSFLQKLERQGARRMVLLGLLLAHEFLGAPLSEQVQEKVGRESALRGLAAGWIAHFQQPPRERSMSAKTAFHLRCRERWRDRIRYLFRLATTSTIEDWSVVSLPESLSFLYWFVRFPRLLRKYGF